MLSRRSLKARWLSRPNERPASGVRCSSKRLNAIDRRPLSGGKRSGPSRKPMPALRREQETSDSNAPGLRGKLDASPVNESAFGLSRSSSNPVAARKRCARLLASGNTPATSRNVEPQSRQ